MSLPFLIELYKRAVRFSEDKHKGQLDKGGEAYYLHPLRVSRACLRLPDNIFRYKCAIVAVLHDVLEDTNTTTEDLRCVGLTDELVDAVLSVTRNENESYSEFVKRASNNEIGRYVKYYDLEDNLDIKRLHKISNDDINRINKYLKWYYYIGDMIKG